MTDITVQLDDRVRLMSALMAATDYPDVAQARRPHGSHMHARGTRRYLARLRDHDAVRATQALLNAGTSPEALFALALGLSLPYFDSDELPDWSPQGYDTLIRNFYQTAELDQWWADEAHEWEKAQADCARILSQVDIKAFLEPFTGPISESLVFLPNISYPTDYEFGVRSGDQLVAIVPPRLAWGDNPPWPFDEDAAHVIRAAIVQFGRQLMTPYFAEHAAQMTAIADAPLPVTPQFASQYPTWQEQFTAIFLSGIVGIYLEDYVSPKEANAYVLMERKVNGLSSLPAVISVLRRYLGERATGRYRALHEFLPVFPKQLRIANRIVSL